MITLVQELNQITVKQETKQLVLEQELNNIYVKQESKQILLKQLQPQIIVKGGGIVELVNIQPFSIVATSNGQTVFILPYVYTMIICLFIMGTGQDPIAGDYTVVGNTVTLGISVPSIQIGDLIFGSGQL